jgi:hypothetical protein
MEVRNILSNNTPGTNRHTPTNSDSRKHYDIAAKPTVLTNSDRLPEFRALDTIAEERIEGMGTAVERAVRSDESASSDCDQAGINEDSVVVDVDTFANPRE